MVAVPKANKRSNHRFVPPETIEGGSLERILWILKDFNKFISLEEKDLHVIPLSSTHALAEGQKERPKAYDMQPVELEVNGKKLTFKYADDPIKMAYLRKALEGVSLNTIMAILEEHNPQPYATQGEKSTSLLCRYALYGENGEQLTYKSLSGKVLPAVIEMTINLPRD
ncbi:MAG: hypothetical protein K2Y08_02365 [Alphaproteobacteria bacterium]|nr:hypothetical protein [Alphaproteobacteria bacterium]